MVPKIDSLTQGQFKRINWLFLNAGIRNPEAIQTVLREYTNRNIQRVEQLQILEAQNLIKSFESIMGSGRKSESEHIQETGTESQKLSLDKMRKGVLKAIFKYFELKGEPVTTAYVKAVACRAAGADDFNRISRAGLRRVYNEFCAKQNLLLSKYLRVRYF